MDVPGRPQIRRAIEILAVTLSALFLAGPAFGQTPQSNGGYEVARLLEVRAVGGVIGFNLAGRRVETFPEALAEKIRAHPEVERIEKYLYVGLVDREGGVPFGIIGGNPPLDTLRVDCHNVERVRIIEGRAFRDEDRGKPVALLGLALASKYAPMGRKRVAVGSTLTLPLPKGEALGLRPASSEVKVRVIGIFSTGFSLGDNQVLLPLDTAQSLFGLEGRVSKLFLRLRSPEGREELAEKLWDALEDEADVILPRFGAARMRNQ